LNVNSGANVANAVTITTGTIGNTAGAGTVSEGGGPNNSNANLTSTTGTGLTVSGVIDDAAGTNSLTTTGPITLSNANTYDGGTTISSVTLTLSNSTAAGTFPYAALFRSLNVNSGANVGNAVTITTGTIGNTAAAG